MADQITQYNDLYTRNLETLKEQGLIPQNCTEIPYEYRGLTTTLLSPAFSTGQEIFNRLYEDKTNKLTNEDKKTIKEMIKGD